MLYGVLPYWDDDMTELFRMIESRLTEPDKCLVIPAERRTDRSNEAKQIVDYILKGNPFLRPSIDECLKHEWMVLHEKQMVSISREKRDRSSSPFLSSLPEIRIGQRSELMRIASHQKSLMDISDDDLLLDDAITPGKAVYIPKILFQKLLKSSTESLQSIAATVVPVTVMSGSTDLDESDGNHSPASVGRQGRRKGEEGSISFPEKKNSFRNFLSPMFPLSRGTSGNVTGGNSDTINTRNPLKTKTMKEEIGLKRGESLGEGDDQDDQEESDVTSTYPSDSSSTSSEDDDKWTWNWEIFESPHLLFRRLTLSPSSSFNSPLYSPPSVPSMSVFFPPSSPPPPPSGVSVPNLEQLFNSFTRNGHQWYPLNLRLPTSCGYCNKMIWGNVLSSSQNIFQCQLCQQIFHQRCCYEEDVEDEDGNCCSPTIAVIGTERETERVMGS
jgi:hypothetical protein